MTLDQQQTNIDSGTGSRFADTTKQKAAQTFKPSIAGNLVNFEMQLIKDGAPSDSLKLEIYSNNAGAPGTLLSTSILIPASTISSTDFTTISFNFLNGPTLTPEITYWAVLSRTGALDDLNFYRYAYGGDFGLERYARGESFYFDGGSWVTNDGSGFTFDAYFREFYDIIPASVSTVPSYAFKIIDKVTAY